MLKCDRWEEVVGFPLGLVGGPIEWTPRPLWVSQHSFSYWSSSTSSVLPSILVAVLSPGCACCLGGVLTVFLITFRLRSGSKEVLDICDLWIKAILLSGFFLLLFFPRVISKLLAPEPCIQNPMQSSVSSTPRHLSNCIFRLLSRMFTVNKYASSCFPPSHHHAFAHVHLECLPPFSQYMVPYNGKTMTLEPRLSETKAWPGMNYLTSQCLGFLI